MDLMPAGNHDGPFEYVLRFLLKPFATAGTFVLVAFLWTLVLQQIFAYPLVFLFLGAVMGSAWFGGAIAGFFSVVLSTIAVGYFFIPPVFSFQIDKASKSYFFAYVICSVAASWVSTMKKRSEAVIREARDQLEQRVIERTEELQRSYTELKKSEYELRALTEAIPQQIWSAGRDGSFQYCNQHLLDAVGRPEAQMMGEQFVEIFHAEDQGLFLESWKAALASGEKLEGVWRICGADRKYRWFLVRALPQRSPDGEITRWYGTLIDMDERERVKQELTTTQNEFARLSRILSLGELTTSIAHEVNQPITAVVTHGYACLGWLQAKPANLGKARMSAEKIVQEGIRAGAVFHRIRALFRGDSESRELADINSMIQNLVRLLREESIQRGARIRTVLSPRLPLAAMDRIQIQQVLLNLANNGLDAMSLVADRPRELVLRSGLDDAGDILVCVEDSGTGVSPEIAGKIFDSFFSTKASGIGMGLSICRTIIEAHEGRLWVQDRPGGGSVFQFTIPVRPQ